MFRVILTALFVFMIAALACGSGESSLPLVQNQPASEESPSSTRSAPESPAAEKPASAATQPTPRAGVDQLPESSTEIQPAEKEKGVEANRTSDINRLRQMTKEQGAAPPSGVAGPVVAMARAEGSVGSAPAGSRPPGSPARRFGIPNDEMLPMMYFEGHAANPFVDADEDALSTFALDGDTGSFQVARLYLNGGRMPPPDSVRVEEWVNSFDQGYQRPRECLALSLDGMLSPFGESGYRLLRVGVASARPDGPRDPVSLIFVLDISGSMSIDNRLWDAKTLMAGMIERLGHEDRVGLVTYGNVARVDYPLTGARDVGGLLAAMEKLYPDGGTNLSEGIAQAYSLAGDELEAERQVRIVVLSDGVGNIGSSGPDSVLAQVEEYALRGAAVTAIGVGASGNYNDAMMEALANRGNGTYHYVSGDEGIADFVNQRVETVFRDVARDARVQVEFDPTVVRKWRLIGYENRTVADGDFRDDRMDFGEPGFARDVTALYELRLQEGAGDGDVLGKIYLRWRDAASSEVTEIDADVSVADVSGTASASSPYLRRSAAVAEFAELARRSYWARCGSLEAVAEFLDSVAVEDVSTELLLDLLERVEEDFEPYCTG